MCEINVFLFTKVAILVLKRAESMCHWRIKRSPEVSGYVPLALKVSR